MTYKLSFPILRSGLIISTTTAFFLSVCSVHASFSQQQMTYAAGMANISYTENPSSLQSSTGTSSTGSTPQSGGISAVAAQVNYERYTSPTFSYFLQSIFPFIPSTTGMYLYAGGGVNFYYKSIGSIGAFRDKDTTITIIPRWRLYWGPQAGFGYLIYTTKTAKKSDVLIDVGVQTGAIYTWSEAWSLRGEVAASRGMGIATTDMVMKLFAGTVYKF